MSINYQRLSRDLFIGLSMMLITGMYFTNQAQDNRAIKGKVLDARQLPISAVSVSVDGITAPPSNSTGQFEVNLPDKPQEVIAQKAGYRMTGWTFHKATKELRIVMQALPTALKGQVMNEQLLPVSGMKITLLDFKPANSVITDSKGRFYMSLPTEYDFSDDIRLSINEGEIKIISLAEAFNQLSFTLPTREKNLELAVRKSTLEREENTIPAAKSDTPQGLDYEDEFEQVTLDLKEERLLLESKSTQLRKEITRITGRLNNEVNLTNERQGELKNYLAKLEKTLKENGIAYQKAQEKTEGVINKMRQVILQKDSLQLESIAKIERIRQEKEIAESEKKATEIQSRRNLVYFSLIVLTLLLLAFVYYLIAKRIRKQSEEIKLQNDVLLAQRNEIERQNENLRELNMEKNGMMNIVAHDLRAPLNRIEGILQLVPLVGNFNKEQEEFFTIINNTLRDGKRFISDLLDVNAIEEHQTVITWEQVEVTSFVQDLLKEYSKQAERKNIQLHYQDEGHETLVTIDRNYLVRILDNLVSNAIKFSHYDREIFISLRSTPDRVHISIRDQGQGISEEDRKMMFKKFQKLSARPTGGENSSGLGLSIVKTLVERLHGNIEVESKPRDGTVFTIDFPLEQTVEKVAPLALQ